jgi:hypothetical protein
VCEYENSFFKFVDSYFFCCQWIFSSMAKAGPESSVLTAEDEAVKQRARRRSYIGGADEEPLKVQAQLPILKSRNEAPDESRPSSEESD